MKFKANILFFIITIFVLVFIGCTDIKDNTTDSEKIIISWDVIDCDKKSEQFIFNWTDNNTGEKFSKISSSISNVSLTIYNNGNQEFSIKVDFEFILKEIIKNMDNEALIITTNKCPCDSINESNNKSKFVNRVLRLQPGDSKTIFASIDLSTIYGYKVVKWCYEINII